MVSLASQGGHDLHLSELSDGRHFISCFTCGAWGFVKSKLLAQDCKLSMQANGLVTHRRIAAGLHPLKANSGILVSTWAVAHRRFVPFVPLEGGVTSGPDRGGVDPRGTAALSANLVVEAPADRGGRTQAQARLAALRARIRLV